MNITGLGQNQYGGQQQGSQIRQMVEQYGSDNLKEMVKGNQMSDQELQQYVLQHPDEMKGAEGKPGAGAPGQTNDAQQWNDGAVSSNDAGPLGSTTKTDKTGNADAAGAAAAAPKDDTQMSEDCGDCYNENDEIPKDEAMATSGMCGMNDVSGADRCKPHTQQCLGETKAIKKVLETIQKADQDNSAIGGDIKEVDGLISDLSQKLKKGKKAADGAFQNPQDASACEKEVDDKVKKAMEIAENNGVEIELSQKRADSLGAGGGQQGAQQSAPAAAGQKSATPAAPAAAGQKPQAAEQTQANQQAQKQNDTQKTTQENQKQNDKTNDAGGGGDDQQKPFKIISEPKEVDKELSLEDVKNNPQLAAALESSLDDTIAQMDAKGEGKEKEGDPSVPQTLDLGATKEGSPLHQGLTSAGKPQDAAGGSVFGSTPSTTSPATTGQTAGKQAGVGGVGGVGAPGGAGSKVNTSGIEAKMKKAGLDTGKKFNVKAQVYEPGMDVKIQRDGDPSPVKVNQNMGDASMKVKPPPLAAIDQNGEMHKIGDIHATDAGKSGVFSAKIKEGAPVMNLPAAVNQVQGDVALPGTKTEDQKATEGVKDVAAKQ